MLHYQIIKEKWLNIKRGKIINIKYVEKFLSQLKDY